MVRCLLTVLLCWNAYILISQDSTLFEKLTQGHSNVTFNNLIVDTKEHSILKYSNFYGGAGVAIADLNNDGLQDIYFAGNLTNDHLYKNLGDLQFEEVSTSAGIVHDGSWSSSVLIVDINNDQLLDIYVTCELYDEQPELRTNKLYINKGDLKFEEVGKKYNLDDSNRTRAATFIDFNKDGYLDIYLLNQPPNPGNYSKYSGQALLRKEWSPRLLKNVKGKYFEDVSEKAGISIPCYPNSAVAADLNNDGWQDIYVANDFDAPDFFFINNKDGTFSNIADEALGHMSYYSMGVDIADINNDGLLDIMTLDMVAEDNFRQKANMGGMYPEKFWKLVKNGGHFQYMFNTLQLNYGKEHFGNVAQLTGMSNTDWSWSNVIADFDNDGWRDVFVTNGLLRDIRNSDMKKEFSTYVKGLSIDYMKKYPEAKFVPILEIMDVQKALEMHPSVPLQNYIFKNNQDLTFSKSNNDWGINEKSFSNGCAYADLDNDGDLEIVVNNINEPAFIYENKSNSNYIRISLTDIENKRTLYGAKVKIVSNKNAQYAEYSVIRGMYSTSESTLHFGLGNQTIVDTILIKWPDGQHQLITGVTANQTLHINKYSEPSHNKEEVVFAAQYEIHSGKDFGINFKHKENEFNDYKMQVLLPHKLSQLGPALAVGDVNGDALDDFYIGGAKDQEGTIYLQLENGHFSKSNFSFTLDSKYEDIDAAFLDFDGDGDLDLYVVSGGNESPSRNRNYLDRLYVNDGKGRFERNSNVIPRILESGSCVRPFDFDQDGDLDLFIGGRLNPWDYPTPSISRLLENTNGHFVDITKERANDFIFNGMVTDATWTDYNEDGLADLVVTGEWMPITFYKNTSEGFIRDLDVQFLQEGINIKTNGWWSHVSATDIDHDGDIDFICGNLGKNYKYKASQEEPFEVHYGDFDDNGKKDIVLSYYNFGDRFPLRGRSCSSEQVPIITDKFPTYDLFAQAGLTDVYSESALNESLQLQSFMFEHIVLLNEGNGKYSVAPLPNELQVSTINEIIPVNPINNSFLVAGNMNQAEIETPKNDASVGAIVHFNQSKVTIDQPSQSGIYLPYDVRKLAPIDINNKEHILVISNNDIVRIIEHKEADTK